MRVCLICRQRNMEEYGICPACQAMNDKMRQITCDLSGKFAVVTGGRIKIGYATALRLLRMGASVIIVTRYPKCALDAYQHESDFKDFKNRLFIIGFDLMRVDRIQELIAQIATICQGKLDILVNNAAQTVKKSNDYYAQLNMQENALSLPYNNQLMQLITQDAMKFSLIPEGQLIDYSETPDHNSWVCKPEEITAQELLEVQLINVTAPFLLTNGLRHCLAYDHAVRKFVINVSSVEGRFNTKQKLARHVHTNMAKASLNMMTHSISTDFVRDEIYVYSCDPGWVSNQFPAAYAISKDFKPYLTFDDGAARVLYPIMMHMHSTEKIKDYGMFYKDYQIIDY